MITISLVSLSLLFDFSLSGHDPLGRSVFSAAGSLNFSGDVLTLVNDSVTEDRRTVGQNQMPVLVLGTEHTVRNTHGRNWERQRRSGRWRETR